jgi:hypothetical protein
MDIIWDATEASIPVESSCAKGMFGLMFDHVCKWYSVNLIQLYNIVFGTTFVAIYVLLGHSLSWVLLRYHWLLSSVVSLKIGTTSALSLLIELCALAHQLSSRYASSCFFRCVCFCLAGYECRHFVHSLVLSFPAVLLTSDHVCLWTLSLITSSVMDKQRHWTIVNKIITWRSSGERSTNSYGPATITNSPGAHIPHQSWWSDYSWYPPNRVKIFQWASR